MTDLKPEYPIEVKVAEALDWTDFIQDKDEGFWWGTPPGRDTRPCPVPPYPTDPGEAIKALEKFCSQWYEKHRDRLSWKITDCNECSIWGLEKARGDGSADCFCEWGESLAHAICLALVKAVKEKK